MKAAPVRLVAGPSPGLDASEGDHPAHRRYAPSARMGAEGRLENGVERVGAMGQQALDLVALGELERCEALRARPLEPIPEPLQPRGRRLAES